MPFVSPFTAAIFNVSGHANFGLCDWPIPVPPFPFSKEKSTGNEVEARNVFEPRRATGSELFSYLACFHTSIFVLLCIFFSLVETIKMEIWDKALYWLREMSTSGSAQKRRVPGADHPCHGVFIEQFIFRSNFPELRLSWECH